MFSWLRLLHNQPNGGLPPPRQRCRGQNRTGLCRMRQGTTMAFLPKFHCLSSVLQLLYTWCPHGSLATWQDPRLPLGCVWQAICKQGSHAVAVSWLPLNANRMKTRKTSLVVAATRLESRALAHHHRFCSRGPSLLTFSRIGGRLITSPP